MLNGTRQVLWLAVFKHAHMQAATFRPVCHSQQLQYKIIYDHRCRAFALEGRGIWHALSASVTQQVIGPVRAQADFRYALDLPSSIPQVVALIHHSIFAC